MSLESGENKDINISSSAGNSKSAVDLHTGRPQSKHTKNLMNIRNNYIEKLNETKEAVSNNQEKLQILHQLE